MKKVWIIFCLLFTPSMLFAAAKSPESINVSVNMIASEVVASKNAIKPKNLQNVITVNKDNHEWTLVKEERSSGSSTVSLLFLKNVRMTAKTVKLNFLIVNVDNKEVMISQPKLTVTYGKEKNINLTEAKQNVALTVQAKIVS